MFPRQTLRKLRLEELTVTNETESNKRADFNAYIKEPLGDYIVPAPLKPAREFLIQQTTFIMMKMMIRTLRILCLRLMILIKW